MITYTIVAGDGYYVGSLHDVCEWQADNQGEGASIMRNTDAVSVDVGLVSFDVDDIGECVFDVLALFAAEDATRAGGAS